MSKLVAGDAASLLERVYCLATPVLALWLVVWIVVSWGGVQDDALIHLRYADNLYQAHFITYDGVHPNYGVSSLLYVYLLAFLRVFTSSPGVPRIVSSCAHLLLFAGLALLFLRAIPRESHLARLLGLAMLVLIVAPSAVRWLDDGMETGLALCFVAVICWITFRQPVGDPTSVIQYFAFVILGFLAILLRTEFFLLAGLSFVLLAWRSLFRSSNQDERQRLQRIVSSSHLLLGGVLALTYIRIKMHFLLPDTAVAKAIHGTSWTATLFATVKVLAGALSFGLGMLAFWLLTIFLLWRVRRFTTIALFANSVFPILLAVAALRGQQVQGARYFIWTFLFSILWNILELGHVPPAHPEPQQGSKLVAVFLVLFLLALPCESIFLYPMLKARSSLLDQFESDHLEILQGKRGIATYVGFIGYFSRADICDLAGLVNGREKAGETTTERIAGCVAAHPDFLFFDAPRIRDVRPFFSYAGWQACSQYYDFKNVDSATRYYLIVPRVFAPQTCRKISNSVPLEIESISR